MNLLHQQKILFLLKERYFRAKNGPETFGDIRWARRRFPFLTCFCSFLVNERRRSYLPRVLWKELVQNAAVQHSTCINGENID